MKATLMILTTAAMLSFQPAQAGDATPCDKAAVVRADRIAADIDRTGQSAPLVQFYNGTAILTKASERQLVELAKLLDDEKDLRIEVSFPAIAVANPGLAAERSAAVRSALVSLHAPADRVAVQPQPSAPKSEFAALSTNGPAAHCSL